MEKEEMRKINVKYCDFCGEETSHLDKCAICKKEMCKKDGGKEHADYSLEIHRYQDGKHICGCKICKDCASQQASGTIADIINKMLN
jgi:hypothetical protein